MSQAMRASPGAAAAQGKGRALVLKAGRNLRPRVNRMIAKYSRVGDPPVFTDRTLFPWTSLLEANWKEVRREAETILADRQSLPPLHAISPDHRRLTSDDRWRSFFLWGYGYKVGANCARCPATTRLVERIPGLKTAMFSILAPGTHIPRHKGVTKAMITCHLGLIVPEPRERCRIEVDGRTCLWEEGRSLVFDDTYPHEVWNDAAGERVVPLIQFARPVRSFGALVSGAFLGAVRLSPFIQDARRNMAAWQRTSGNAGDPA